MIVVGFVEYVGLGSRVDSWSELAIRQSQDAIYGEKVQRRIRSLAIEEVHSSSFTMAKSLRRKNHWIHTPRLPGSRHCSQ